MTLLSYSLLSLESNSITLERGPPNFECWGLSALSLSFDSPSSRVITRRIADIPNQQEPSYRQSGIRVD
jgi:hypothetical protein